MDNDGDDDDERMAVFRVSRFRYLHLLMLWPILVSRYVIHMLVRKKKEEINQPHNVRLSQEDTQEKRQDGWVYRR